MTGRDEDMPFTIGVMGAGSIGCFVGGKLLAAGARVTLVGRERLQAEIAEHGLTVKDFDRPGARTAPGDVSFTTDAGDLAACDAVLVCVKSAQTAEVGAELDGILRDDCVVASLQNGVGNAPVLRDALGSREVLAAIVGFNVVSRGEGLFHRAMSGSLMLEAPTSSPARTLIDVLRGALETEVRADLAPDQWTKLLVNLNNAVSALSGAPTRQLLLTPLYRRIIAAIIEEALRVLKAAGIRPAKLRGVPVGIMPTVMRLPTPLVRLVTRAQMRVDPEARSSMWEDLTRRRKTEIDFLNGEIVRLAEKVGQDAPVNRRIVELVREAEAANEGPPNIAAERLWDMVRSGG